MIHVVLTDGSVYDILGLETVWKRYGTVLVSDAGGKMQGKAEPERDGLGYALRVLNLVNSQVRWLRRRQVISAYQSGDRQGAYWGIHSNIAEYDLPTALPCPFDRTTELANTPVQLERMDSRLQQRLINWGYAVCDAAMRQHTEPELPMPKGFPYPDRQV